MNIENLRNWKHDADEALSAVLIARNKSLGYIGRGREAEEAHAFLDKAWMDMEVAVGCIRRLLNQHEDNP